MRLSRYEAGLSEMVKQRGSLDDLGLNGRLASFTSVIVVVSAILREAQPEPVFTSYCRSHLALTYPSHTLLPESPLFRPHGHYFTLQCSGQCIDNTLDMIHDIHSIIMIFLSYVSQNAPAVQTPKNQLIDDSRVLSATNPGVQLRNIIRRSLCSPT